MMLCHTHGFVYKFYQNVIIINIIDLSYGDPFRDDLRTSWINSMLVYHVKHKDVYVYIMLLCVLNFDHGTTVH